MDAGLAEEGAEDLSPVFRRVGTMRGALLERLKCSVESVDKLVHLEAGQTGGVYTVPDLEDSSPLAVFKSEAEENFERRGIPHGSGAMREEAAYLLDRLTGSTAGVPVTTRAEVPGSMLDGGLDSIFDVEEDHFKRQTSRGSVQQFVSDVAGAAEDFGMPRDLQAAAGVVPTLAAQQIAAFDISLCNTDRHAGNLLFKSPAPGDTKPLPGSPKTPYAPVPIDHGCALPRWWAMGEANFEAWSSWPQVSCPCLPEVLGTVEAAYKGREKAVRTLRRVGLEPAARATYVIAVTLLREGTVRHGLSLATVAGLLSRNSRNPGEPSWLEERMAECAAELDIDWQWTESVYGDKVPAPPQQPEAWPPEGMVERLVEIFRSEATRIAGKQWDEEER